MPTVNIKDITEPKIVRLVDLSEDSINKIAEAVVRKIAVDAIEVVRCKDCRWYENDGYHTNCQIMRFCVEAEDYCSRGERREDENI